MIFKARAFCAAFVTTTLAFSIAGCGGNRGYWPNQGGWPNNGGSNNVSQSLTCESNDGGSHACRAGFPIAQVKIEQRLSKSPCDFGRTWGYNNDRVWVDQGCRARFRVYAQGGGNGNGGGNWPWNGGGNNNKNVVTIRCESINGGWKRCNSPFKIGRVEVAQRLSGKPCKYKDNWGNDNWGIWVERGCQADFRVYRN